MKVTELIKQLNKLKKSEPDAEVFFATDKKLYSTDQMVKGYTDSIDSLFNFEIDKTSKNKTEKLQTPFILIGEKDDNK